ncbi:acyltransferase family protein [Oceanithermus sp.]
MDGVRGIAVALVILFHFFPDAFPFGYVGVDLFFVLSGYLITRVILKRLDQGRFSFAEFYRNRARRLFPALSILLLVALAVGYMFLFPQEYAQLGLHVNSSAWYYQNFRLMHEIGYWDAAALAKPLLHLWSLAIEEQFYLAWPAVLVLFMLLERRSSLRLSHMTAAALALFFAISIFLTERDAQSAFYNTLARVWEPLLGAALAVFLDDWIMQLPRKVAWAAFVILLVYTPLALGIGQYDPLRIGVFLLLASIWFVPLAHERNRWLSHPAVVWLGLTSYSLYLWHYLVISFLFIFGYQAYAFGGLLASFVLAWASFNLVEAPARRQPSYGFALTATVVLAFIGLLGYGVSAQEGLPQRTVAQIYEDQSVQLIREPKTNDACIRLATTILGKAPVFDYCKATSGSPEVISYAVVGDSHAEVLYNGIRDVLAKKRIQGVLLANSGKPAYLGGYRGKTPKDVETSREKIDQIYRVLDGLDQLRLVVMTTRMAIYATERGFGETERRFTQNPTHYASYFEGDDNYNPEKLFLKYLNQTLKYFEHRHVNVILVLENPELGFPPNACLQRSFLPLPKHCLIPRTQVDARLGDIKRKVSEVANRFSNVTIIDLEDFFCDSQTCYVVRNGTMLYADDDHMSLAASRQIAQQIEPLLLSKLGQK